MAKQRHSNSAADRDVKLGPYLAEFIGRVSIGNPRDLLKVVQSLQAKDLTLSYEDLEYVVTKIHRGPGLYSFSDFLGAFLRLIVKSTPVDRFLGLANSLMIEAIPVAVASRAKQITLIDRADFAQIGQSLDTPVSMTWKGQTYDETLVWLADQPDDFDLIYGVPIFGMQGSQKTRDELGLAGSVDPSWVLIANACLKLSASGLGVFIVSEQLLASSKQVLEQLASRGLIVQGVVAIPRGDSFPVSIQPVIILVGRQAAENLFVAELTADERRNRTVWRLYQQRHAAQDPSMGLLLEPETFVGVQAAIELAQLKIEAAKLGLKPEPLSTLSNRVDQVDRDKPFEHYPNSIYIPQRLGTVHTLPTDLTANHYWRIELNRERADADYAAKLLNLPIGKMMLRAVATGSTIPNLSRTGIERLELYLPGIEVQRQTINNDNQIERLIQDLTELRRDLWSKPHIDTPVDSRINTIFDAAVNEADRFRIWVDTLPFPLASILWAYHATDSPYKKYRLLLRYFEGLTEYMATVLLSGFFGAEDWMSRHRRLFNEYKDEPKVTSKLQFASFGMWSNITQALANDLRKRLALNKERLTDEDLASRKRCEQLFCTDVELLDQLFPVAVVDVLARTVELRNDWYGHGGIDDKAAETRLYQLESHLNETRRLLGRTWASYRLIKPEGSRKTVGVIQQDIKILVGHHNPFVSEKIELGAQLDTAYLYLHQPGRSSAMKMQPLIRILEQLAGTENAAYFYSRVRASDVVFISHHFEQEPDMTEPFRETLELLEKLKNLSPEDATNADD